MDYFSGKMQEIADLGVNIIGGCCGTSPEYIRLLPKKVDVFREAVRQKPLVMGKGEDTQELFINAGIRKIL